ncbi:MAG: hypothetical protein PUA52_04125 [Lachnospiraceae bacterium]|nr:hypothetical protein [Lachnospiraceae bacterium]
MIETREKVQKIFRVFRILTKLGMIMTFVWAGITLLGLLFFLVWCAGGRVMGLNGETLMTFMKTGAVNEVIGTLLADLFWALSDGFLLTMACRYFALEEAEGTPFTAGGARRLRNLGIYAIVLPLAAVIIGAVIMAIAAPGKDLPGDGNLPGLITGILLITASVIFRYGAELEAKTAACAASVSTAPTGEEPVSAAPVNTVSDNSTE